MSNAYSKSVHSGALTRVAWLPTLGVGATRHALAYLFVGLAYALTCEAGSIDEAWFAAYSIDEACSAAYDNANDGTNFERCRERALAGDTSAQFGYGLVLMAGYDRTHDQVEAFQWFRRAARQGHLLARSALADLLNHPETDLSARDDAEAYAWQKTSLGRERQASELWERLSPAQRARANALTEEIKTKYAPTK